MKKSILILVVILISAHCMAQRQLSFPFRGGKEEMARFFKDSLIVSQEIIQKKAIGTAVFKFTADENGAISKIVVYYADDYILVTPIIDALRKSNHKWVIPGPERRHDFIISFVYSFTAPQTDNLDLQKIVYENYRTHSAIAATDQVPLNEATLLPPVVVSYDILQ
jgi:hypothetical protein